MMSYGRYVVETDGCNGVVIADRNDPRLSRPAVTAVCVVMLVGVLIGVLTGSVAPVRVRHLGPSTVDAEATRWVGAAVGRHGLRQPLAEQALRQYREAALTARLAGVDAGPVDLAVAAFDRRTGRAYGYAGTTRFRTASIVKVDILATLLVQAAAKGRALTAAEHRLATAMIRISDNDAASTLWRRTGGIATLGLSSTREGSGGDWGETVTTADDQLRVLRDLADGAVPGGGYVLDLMAGVASGQNWGVSAAARQGERTALKNGWYPVSGGWILNSMGRVTDGDTDLLLVVLSDGHGSYPSGVRAVEEVAAAVREAFDGTV